MLYILIVVLVTWASAFVKARLAVQFRRVFSIVCELGCNKVDFKSKIILETEVEMDSLLFSVSMKKLASDHSLKQALNCSQRKSGRKAKIRKRKMMSSLDSNSYHCSFQMQAVSQSSGFSTPSQWRPIAFVKFPVNRDIRKVTDISTMLTVL